MQHPLPPQPPGPDRVAILKFDDRNRYGTDGVPATLLYGGGVKYIVTCKTPTKLNQWANVVRWEMRTRMFLRTSEFLWQEGHTAHADEAEAKEHTLTMLEVYRAFADEDLALAVVPGEKPENERFPGAVETWSIEAMMQDGKALQAGTSHYLGTNFAQASGIKYQNREGGESLAHTTSWGVSTRMVGGVIMTHGDDDGLRLPPKIAPQQVVILPMLRDKPEDQALIDYCEVLRATLARQSVLGEPLRVLLDTRPGKAAQKRWDYVRKGAPVIVEVGGRDMDNGVVSMLRRLAGPRVEQDAQRFAEGALPGEGGTQGFAIFDQRIVFRLLAQHGKDHDLLRGDLGREAQAIIVAMRHDDAADHAGGDAPTGRVGETFDTRITGVQAFGFFATIDKLGGDGLVPVSTLGREYFTYDEKAQKLVGEKTGTEYATGDRLKLKLAEANALTGALKFEVPDSDGKGIEPRGNRPPPKKRTHQKNGAGAPRQTHDQGKRGRPGNIRHQGRRK